MSEITPEEIRSIRERLGLTQIDAGTLIGGGPRAFAKYEAGTVKPAAAVTNLLRVLENHPGVMSTLKGDSSRPMSPAVPSPFEVDSEDIKRLDERKLPELLRRLLNAESQSNDLPFCVINVPSNIHTADGGEDGRIIWQGGPSRTWFLPSRLCQFQLKAGMTSPTRAANDVVNKTVVKEAVRSVLEANGNYIMLCAHPYVDRQLRLRKTEILKKLHSSGLTVNDDQIDFRDANQIAMWVNHHLPVAIWVREYTQPGTLGPFRSWSHWSGPTEPHQLAWVDDERLPGLRDPLDPAADEASTGHSRCRGVRHRQVPSDPGGIQVYGGGRDDRTPPQRHRYVRGTIQRRFQSHHSGCSEPSGFWGKGGRGRRQLRR